MGKSRFSRRQFLKVTGAGLIGASLMPLANGWADKKNEIIVCSWGGGYQKALRKAYYDPFEKETGIKVQDTSAPEVAKVKAQVDAKNIEWDVIEGGTRWYNVLVKQGLVQALDLKKISTSDLIPGAALSHGISHLVTSMNLAYNTNIFPNQRPDNWADFWNVTKFPGPRAYMADVTYALEFALLADGVPPDKLYPIDVERAFKKLNELKPHIKVFWKHGDQPVQLVSQGEVAMAPAHNGRVHAAQEKGIPIALTWNQGSCSMSYLYIMTGAPQPELGLKFINFCASPKPQADAAIEIPYGPTNKKAFDLIPPDRRKDLPTYPDNLKRMWALDGKWLGDNYDMINDRWQKFMLS